MDQILDLEALVEQKTALGELHPQVLLKLEPLQYFNWTLQPGCRNLQYLLVVARTLGDCPLDLGLLTSLTDTLERSTMEEDLLKITGQDILNDRQRLALLSRHRPRNRVTHKELAHSFEVSTCRASVIERGVTSSVCITLKSSIFPYLRSAIFECADLLPDLRYPPRRTGKGRSPLPSDPLPAISERLGQVCSHQTAHRLLTVWFALTVESHWRLDDLTDPPELDPPPSLSVQIHQLEPA